MLRALHFENESCAVVAPAPTEMPKVLLVFFGFKEPLKVTVWLVGDGPGGVIVVELPRRPAAASLPA